MSRDECITFKVFLKNNEVTEVKNLTVDGNNASVTNVSFIRQMLQSAFAILPDVNFWITWRDRQGDDVLIEKDEDLIRALTEMDGPVKTLYLIAWSGYMSGNPPKVMNTPARILCGVCNRETTNFRYTCLQCNGYEHCIECEYSGQHSQHEMMRTSFWDPPFNKWEFKKGRDRRDVSDVGCSSQEHAPRSYPLINAGSLAANATSNTTNNTAASGAAVTAEASSPSQPPKPSKQIKLPSWSEEEQSSDEEAFFQEYMPIYDHSINVATSQAGNTAASKTSNVAAVETKASAPFEEPESPTQTKSISRLNKRQNASYKFVKTDTTASSNVETVPEQTSALDIAIGLRRLVEMGFQDEQVLVALLKRYNGNVNEVARDILENNGA